MNNLRMYCLTMKPSHEKLILELGYHPVGLGDKNFSNKFLSDKSDNNISKKNPYYGEYTFHYWLWKNQLDKMGSEWIGFCQYRKFFTEYMVSEKNISFKNLCGAVLKNIPKELDNYDSFIGEPFYINQFRFSKFIKRNFYKMISNPSLIFFKNKRNIKFHFDMWHGNGNLDSAIDLIEGDDREEFRHYVNSKVYFSPHNMFICKKSTLKKYYEAVLPWLNRCEALFGFEDLKGYGLKRIYGFLAERYLSFWFKKYTRFKEMPIFFKDLSDFNEL